MTESFKLKMRSLTLPVLHILDNRIEVIEQQLKNLKKQAPNLFQMSPMVIEISEALAAEAPDGPLIYLSMLCGMLRQYGILPVGFQSPQGIDDVYEKAAKQLEMPIFSVSKQERDMSLSEVRSESRPEPKKPSIMTEITANVSKIITKPVRSGQQVYAEGGDLIILASVSPGAELLADGNIHVYGVLYGRALAGIQGNPEARIFCQSLEADLISIAGKYMVSDVIDRRKTAGAQQVYLEEDKLYITAL